MKTLLTLVLFSTNVMAADLGEVKHTECTFSDQSAKRSAKVIEDNTEKVEADKNSKTISK